MKDIMLLYKPVGKTPLEAIEQFKADNIEYKDSKLGYAGRLDPMAEGLLLILVGEENKNKKNYQDLDKEYECEVLFGVSTDTYDILGVITDSSPQALSKNEILKRVQNDTDKMVGEQIQSYPPYSSKTVDGKPLFQYARENRLQDIEIPTRKITIYSIKVLDFITLHSKDLKKIIMDKLEIVQGDFRQDEIKKEWTKFFINNTEQEFLVLKLVVRCSSGTYIRSLAHELGKKLGTGALALGIKRTKIGDYFL